MRGKPAVSVFEDVAFVRRLRRVGMLAFPPVRALTSPRRWEERGVLGTTLFNWCLIGLYAAGANPNRLARIYNGRRIA